MPADPTLLKNLNDPGWQVALILAEDERPDFAFTVGLYHSFQHSEILIMGLDREIMHQILNEIGAQVKKGASYSESDEVSGLIDGYECVFGPIRRENYREYLGSAIGLYEGYDFPALQLFWPDKQSLFPWEDGFNPHWLKHQRMLFVPMETPESPPIPPDWPFEDPTNLGTITTADVLEKGYPIFFVTHDEEDGRWQFHCGTSVQEEDCRLVSLGSMVEIDPSLKELADLPLGWTAWRVSVGADWQRAPTPARDDDDGD